MDKLPPVDASGKDLRIGDWVRVNTVPLSIADLPDDSKEVFSRAVGHTFQITEFDDFGCLRLELWPKLGADTIWVEAYCVRRTRRYKKFSKAFQNQLDLAQAPIPRRVELKFEITLKAGADCEAFGHELMAFATGGGFAVRQEQRRIRGSVYANLDEPDALEMLDRARNHALSAEDIASVTFEDIVTEED